MGRNVIETVLGAVVLIVAAFFLTFAYRSSDLNKVGGYKVVANFPSIDGVKIGTDVKVNGVKIGSVVGEHLLTDPGATQFLVELELSIDPSVKLPADTVAMIANESLLGGKYLSLEVGVEDETIKTDGSGRITRTQAPLRLDDLIGQMIFNKQKEKEQQNGTHAASAPAEAPGAPVAP